MNTGKTIRYTRIMDHMSKRTIIIPMDHGMTLGPIAGLESMETTVAEMWQGGANAVLMHKGFIPNCCTQFGKNTALILHLSASTSLSPRCDTKVLTTSVQEALRMGADGVSVHVNLGSADEHHMLADMGRIAEECALWGMPLLAMVYARAPHIADEFAPEVVAHCARAGAELGADIVKVAYPGTAQAFAKVVRSCDIPVVIAGGPYMGSDKALLQMVADSVAAGGAGISIGRNVFQHPERAALVEALEAIVHHDATAEEGLALLNRNKR